MTSNNRCLYHAGYKNAKNITNKKIHINRFHNLPPKKKKKEKKRKKDPKQKQKQNKKPTTTNNRGSKRTHAYRTSGSHKYWSLP